MHKGQCHRNLLQVGLASCRAVVYELRGAKLVYGIDVAPALHFVDEAADLWSPACLRLLAGLARAIFFRVASALRPKR